LNSPSVTTSGRGESAGAVTVPTMRALCSASSSIASRSSETIVTVKSSGDPSSRPCRSAASYSFVTVVDANPLIVSVNWIPGRGGFVSGRGREGSE